MGLAPIYLAHIQLEMEMEMGAGTPRPCRS